MTTLGRPRLVTEERLIEAGRAITLPKLSIRAVAQYLDVSEVSIYRRAGNIENLKRIVAIGIVANTNIPAPDDKDPEDALVRLGVALRRFVLDHPGISHYLIHLGAEEPAILTRVEYYYAAFHKQYGWSKQKAALIVGMMTEHSVALANLDPVSHHQALDVIKPELLDKCPVLRAGLELVSDSDAESIFANSMRAIARGAMSLFKDL